MDDDGFELCPKCGGGRVWIEDSPEIRCDGCEFAWTIGDLGERSPELALEHDRLEAVAGELHPDHWPAWLVHRAASYVVFVGGEEICEGCDDPTTGRIAGAQGRASCLLCEIDRQAMIDQIVGGDGPIFTTFDSKPKQGELFG